MKSHSRSSRRGIALVMVLSIILLVTILVVGLTVAMRMERSASHYHLERTRAELFARSGVDYGQALLRGATATNRFWVSAPGTILASASNSFDRPDIAIALSSGLTNSTDTNSTDTNAAVDLNRPGWNLSDRLLHPGGTNLTVRWIYVDEDGTYRDSTNTSVVGRFAFWIDDDSTRVNVNTAGRRAGNTATLASPTQISLEALPGATDLAAITNFAATNIFRTTAEVFAVEPDLGQSRYFLTAYSQDPDVTPWHEPRRVLTTSGNRAGGRPYLDILVATNATPGLLSGIEAIKLQSVYTNITPALIRTNWPYAPGSSFATKFGDSAVPQIALDIIEYVRSTESTNTWVQPLVAVATTNSLAPQAGTTTLDAIPNNALIGTVRRPMITQIGLYCSTNTNSTGYLGTLHAQLLLPVTYNAGITALEDTYLFAEMDSSSGGGPLTSTSPLGTITFTGGYANVSVPNFSVPAAPSSSVPTNATVRLALLKTATPQISEILDIAPLAANAKLALPTGPELTGYTSINDPRLNKNPNNWSASTNLLAGDTVPPGHSPTFPPYPDSDGDAVSVYFPSPNSVVGSVGELGFVVTGLSGTPSPAPWRSIRLRPGSSPDADTVPDWALLDVFSAPIPGSTTMQARYLPGNHTVAGRINLNASVPESASFSRTNSLNALLTNTAVANLPTALVNILTTSNLATGGVNFSGDHPRLLSVGQIAELAGISDNGEASEEVIRQVASVASVRTGVFSITSVGQAVQISPDGRMRVTGERMVRATVERYLDSTGAVKFRTLGWSEIYP